MPRKGRNRKNFVAIPFHASVALGALANDISVSVTPITFGEDIFVISTEATVALREHTAGEGPLEVWSSHGDLNLTEVEENLQAEVSDPDDIIARERARRPVRRWGTFAGLSTEEVLNNGVPMKKPHRFSIGDGHTLRLGVANRSGATLTTGGFVVFDGNIYGRWQR